MTQWRIYIEAKEAVLGGPRTHRAPQIYKRKCKKYKIIGPLVKKKGYGAFGTPQSQLLRA